MKRRLLDQLAERHDFPVPPPSMVDARVRQHHGPAAPRGEPRGRPDAALARSSRIRRISRIAERRVRLGLLLSEIGAANGIEISQQEMNR
jgi:trigger factor